MIALERIEQLYRSQGTPLIETPVLPGPGGHLLKCENLQWSGAYKARAAWALWESLEPEQRKLGAALSSSGNFATAFCMAAALWGGKASVVMMPSTAGVKVARVREAGGRVVFCENRYTARFERLAELAREESLTAFDHREHPLVLAAHGGVGLELARQLPEVDCVLVPVSTGGLLAGVASALKQLRPEIRVLGVSPSGNPAAAESFAGRKLVARPVDTACDALTADSPGKLPFQIMLEAVDDILVVSEGAVMAAAAQILARHKLLVEPGGAVGYAAFLENQIQGRACLLLSGGNVDPVRLVSK